MKRIFFGLLLASLLITSCGKQTHRLVGDDIPLYKEIGEELVSYGGFLNMEQMMTFCEKNWPEPEKKDLCRDIVILETATFGKVEFSRIIMRASHEVNPEAEGVWVESKYVEESNGHIG